jgi:NAD(P)-dependent dehydrogenase (short-subunit alcohol dehydrogenase family)/pimeloyl-ACP methyl ester carboxylesterase
MKADLKPQSNLRSGAFELALYSWGEPQPDRPTIVLVHGYPDSASVWTDVAEALSSRFHVVAYDVRGAGHSSVPKRIADYSLDRLVDDLGAVLDAVSPTRPVHLVGHDWGSIQSWEAVTTDRLSGRIASYTSISGPSLDHAAFWLRRRLGSASPRKLALAARQFAHSWYIGLFHLPAVAPTLWKYGLDRLWPRLRETLDGTPTALTSTTQRVDGLNGINLYRANVLDRLLRPRQRSTDLPVQLVVPRQDPFMVAEIWDDLPQWAPRLWRREIEAGHWVPLTHARTIANWIAEFVSHVEGGKESAALQRARVVARQGHRPYTGRSVVVTGAGSGFGREIALLFAELGADIVAVDIDAKAAERTAELARLLGAQAWSRWVDVSSAEHMEGLAHWVGEQFGAADIVVNNAGIGLAGSFFDTKAEDWERVLKVNLWGVIHGSRLFGQQMRAKGRRGHIVNVASMGAFTPSRFMSAYNTSKAAVRMLSDCLRAELADSGIGVSTICPGLSITGITTSTRFVGSDSGEQERKRSAATRLYERRNLQPAAIARAVLRAVEHNEAEVPVGAEAWTARWISRLSPALSRRLARLDSGL